MGMLPLCLLLLAAQSSPPDTLDADPRWLLEDGLVTASEYEEMLELETSKAITQGPAVGRLAAQAHTRIDSGMQPRNTAWSANGRYLHGWGGVAGDSTLRTWFLAWKDRPLGGGVGYWSSSLVDLAFLSVQARPGAWVQVTTRSLDAVAAATLDSLRWLELGGKRLSIGASSAPAETSAFTRAALGDFQVSAWRNLRRAGTLLHLKSKSSVADLHIAQELWVNSLDAAPRSIRLTKRQASSLLLSQATLAQGCGAWSLGLSERLRIAKDSVHPGQPEWFLGTTLQHAKPYAKLQASLDGLGSDSAFASHAGLRAERSLDHESELWLTGAALWSVAGTHAAPIPQLESGLARRTRLGTTQLTLVTPVDYSTTRRLRVRVSASGRPFPWLLCSLRTSLDARPFSSPRFNAPRVDAFVNFSL